MNFHNNILDNNLKLAENAVLSVEESLSKVFQERSNQVFQKLENILTIFKEEKVSTSHFNQSSGSGHDDISREKIDAVFARLFLAEKAAVRMQFVSGTHAISSVLFGILRPGDVMLSLTGQPYDTLEEVIGIRGGGKGSLKDFDIEYKQVNICENFDSFEEKIVHFFKENSCKLVFIQKSCGYSWRKSLTNHQIEKICSLIHSLDPNCICFVDNCYGELVEDSEPISKGANIIAGSLIKNLGGTIVPTGGYVAGDAELVEMACSRLTSPGIGSSAGINFGLGRLILQGLFLAPQIVHESLKGADMVAYSGGKGLRGPQSTGILCGKKDLIDAAFLHSAPNNEGIGRVAKVSKEEIIGLITALEIKYEITKNNFICLN